MELDVIVEKDGLRDGQHCDGRFGIYARIHGAAHGY